MHRIVLKSKIHRATVSRSDVAHEGSPRISPAPMRVAGRLPGERVHRSTLSRGSRVHAPARAGAAGGPGRPGAIAHLGSIGDLVDVLTHTHLDEAEPTPYQAGVVHADGADRPRAEVAVP